MRSRYNPDGSIDYEADREIEMLRHVDGELERLRREHAESGHLPESESQNPFFKPTVKLLKKAGLLSPPVGMTQPELFQLPLPIQPPTGIPNFLKPKPKLKS